MSEYIPFIFPPKEIEGEDISANAANLLIGGGTKSVSANNDAVISQKGVSVTPVLIDANPAQKSANPDARQPAQPPGACNCCHETRRWRSVYGVIICGTCHPPRNAALVETWLEASAV